MVLMIFNTVTEFNLLPVRGVFLCDHRGMTKFKVTTEDHVQTQTTTREPSVCGSYSTEAVFDIVYDICLAT